MKVKLYIQELDLILVINDGDMGSNVLAKRRGITSLFVTNQFKPKLMEISIIFLSIISFCSKTNCKSI